LRDAGGEHTPSFRHNSLYRTKAANIYPVLSHNQRRRLMELSEAGVAELIAGADA